MNKGVIVGRIETFKIKNKGFGAARICEITPDEHMIWEVGEK